MEWNQSIWSYGRLGEQCYPGLQECYLTRSVSQNSEAWPEWAGGKCESGTAAQSAILVLITQTSTSVESGWVTRLFVATREWNTFDTFGSCSWTPALIFAFYFFRLAVLYQVTYFIYLLPIYLFVLYSAMALWLFKQYLCRLEHTYYFLQNTNV